MDREKVNSSNIAEVGFDAASSTLEIMFTDGRIYQYFDVPQHTYEELRGASSAGQFFHANIRGAFRYARV